MIIIIIEVLALAVVYHHNETIITIIMRTYVLPMWGETKALTNRRKTNTTLTGLRNRTTQPNARR